MFIGLRGSAEDEEVTRMQERSRVDEVPLVDAPNVSEYFMLTADKSANRAQFTLIANVPFDTVRQDLLSEFRRFGKVELAMVVCDEASRHPHREWTSTAGYAFVRFSRREEAAAAIQAAALGLISIRGTRVRADWARKDSYAKRGGAHNQWAANGEDSHSSSTTGGRRTSSPHSDSQPTKPLQLPTFSPNTYNSASNYQNTSYNSGYGGASTTYGGASTTYASFGGSLAPTEFFGGSDLSPCSKGLLNSALKDVFGRPDDSSSPVAAGWAYSPMNANTKAPGFGFNNAENQIPGITTQTSSDLLLQCISPDLL